MTSAITPEGAVDLIEKEFNFTVDKFPLRGPDGCKAPNWYGLFTSDGDPVGSTSVGKDYVPHRTEDVIALVKASATAFDSDMDCRCHFNAGHYVELAPTKEYRKSIYGEKDNIWPRINIRAGYDGRAFIARCGWYRDACSNMAELRSVQSASVKIRHCADLPNKMESLILTFGKLKDSWDDVGATIAALEAQQVSFSKFIADVYETGKKDTDRKKANFQDLADIIFNRVLKEREITGRPEIKQGQWDGQVSAWEAFNAVQGYAQHGRSRKFTDDPYQKALLASDDYYVKRMEKLMLAQGILAA